MPSCKLANFYAAAQHAYSCTYVVVAASNAQGIKSSSDSTIMHAAAVEPRGRRSEKRSQEVWQVLAQQLDHAPN